MTVTVTIECPSCHRRLRMPEVMVGRTVKCPACGTSFPAAVSPSEPSPAPPEERSPAVEAPAEPSAPPTVPVPETVPPAGKTDVPALAPPEMDSAQVQVITDYLLFRRMIAPVLIQLVFWGGVVASLFYGMALVVLGLFAERQMDSVRILTGVGLLFLGPLTIRLYCEMLILFFRMNETLMDIRDKLTKSQ